MTREAKATLGPPTLSVTLKDSRYAMTFCLEYPGAVEILRMHESHAALLEACEAALRYVKADADDESNEWANEVDAKLRAAIALAKGEK